MTYIELTFNNIASEGLQEILIALLTSVGCDSFLEDQDGLKAYCPANVYNESKVKTVLSKSMFAAVHFVAANTLEDKNWNEIWESNYEPVLIDGKCLIRAPFHHNLPQAAYELVIEPKMSFGTAHHETTSQMIQMLLQLNVRGLSLLDMGCGTGVLAILAHKMGAMPVVAIDNDVWAYNNAKENVHLNQTDDIQVELGNASCLGNRTFDVILANINRNILLQDIPSYAKALKHQSQILLSGFYVADLDIIQKATTVSSLQLVRYISDNEWAAASFIKE